MSDQPIVRVEHVSLSYGDRLALDDVSLDLHAGEVLSLVGPNGAGKSTLLKAIARLATLDRGRIEYGSALGDEPRSGIIYVPQRDRIDWTLPASVRDLVLMGAYGSVSRWRRIGRTTRARADWALEKVGILHHAGTQIGRLSGGQQQRVILARALIRPGLVYLLDEPFTGVDAPTEAIFETVIDELRADGAAVILATHNLDCARTMGDRLCVLNRRIVALGTPDEALTPLTIAVGYGDISALHQPRDAAHA
jgi:ABC-type Mn2+/Zn2+ transport system ATPase subunit